jgi:hypothetical protein
MQLDKLTSADFRPHMGQDFHVHYGGETPFVIVLSAVEDYPQPAHDGLRAPFSLLFHGPRDPYLRQGVYAIEHPQMGRAEIFIVPLGADSIGMRYEIIFA